MIARAVLRRDEQDEDIDRLPIQAVESDALVGDSDSANQAIDAVVLGMGNGDASANAGGAEELAFENGPDNVFQIGAAELAGSPQALDHGADDAFLVGGRQVRDNGLAHHEVGHSHASSSVIPRWTVPPRAYRLPCRPRASGDGPESFLYSDATATLICPAPDPLLLSGRDGSRGLRNHVYARPARQIRPAFGLSSGPPSPRSW